MLDGQTDRANLDDLDCIAVFPSTDQDLTKVAKAERRSEQQQKQKTKEKGRHMVWWCWWRNFFWFLEVKIWLEGPDRHMQMSDVHETV